jgi:hypothetical protein
MAYNQLSTYRTTIDHLCDGRTVIRYHATAIVTFDASTITLRSGGWQGVTTKRKMNQASHQFGLGYSVSQKDFHWSVTLPDGSTVDFEDGMTFARHPYAGLGFAPLPEGVQLVPLDDPEALHNAIAAAVGE